MKSQAGCWLLSPGPGRLPLGLALEGQQANGQSGEGSLEIPQTQEVAEGHRCQEVTGSWGMAEMGVMQVERGLQEALCKKCVCAICDTGQTLPRAVVPALLSSWEE